MKSGDIEQVSSAALSHYSDVARRLGLAPESMMCKAGLTSYDLSSPMQPIPLKCVLSLLDISAKESACSTFGLQLAEARVLSDFGPISLLLKHLPCMRIALQAMDQYRHLLNESLGIYVEDAGNKTIIHEEIMTDYSGGTQQATDLALGLLMLVFRSVLGENWRPQAVHFTYPANNDLQIYRRIFGCSLNFESDFNGVVCMKADMDRSNEHADVSMARHAQLLIDSIHTNQQRSLVQDVRRLVYLFLPMGRASLEQIASNLGENARTIQRKLNDCGVSFSELLNDTRSKLARRYVVHSQYSMGHVANLLGYSNLSSFTRWFTLQFDCSPSHMRKIVFGKPYHLADVQ